MSRIARLAFRPAFASILLLATLRLLAGQAPAAQPATSAVAAAAAPCCGLITPEAHRLIALLDSMDVEHHWLAHERVKWESGVPVNSTYIEHDTHCSAFAAAVSLRLGVYLLRPPEHKTEFLASAQGEWLGSHAASRDGWTPVSALDAQRLANLGEFVVVDYISPDPHKPGHIAVVRPSVKPLALLLQDGPEITQAGANNFADNVVRVGFNHHPGAFPGNVRYYAHPVDWRNLPPAANAR